jgi:hypothetical protein
MVGTSPKALLAEFKRIVKIMDAETKKAAMAFLAFFLSDGSRLW